MSYTVKPQTPLMLGENFILPITSYDQIIMPDDTRWDGMLGKTYRAGNGISISEDCMVSIKVGEGLKISEDGTISLALINGDEVSY